MELPALYLSNYIIQYKDKYYANLRKVTEEGNWQDWIMYMLDMVEQTSLKGRNQIAEIEELMNQMGKEIQEQLPKIYSKDLMEELFRLPYTKRNQLEKAGLIQQLGNFIASYSGSNLLLLIFATTILSIFISEVMSNVAQVIVFAPVMAGIADALKIDPLYLGIPMTLAASCASMLPMGTPPNAIVFASGRLKLNDMIKTGLVMNLIATVLITLFSYYLIPILVHTIR